MSKRLNIAIGNVVALLWSVAIIWLPQTMTPPFLPFNTLIIMAVLPGGLVMMLLIIRQALRRFFDDNTIEGEAFLPGSGADIDQRVLSNTTEQLMLALVLWPFVALTLGALVVLFMGVGFGVARLAFWFGYHVSPALKAFGFAATFYPTVLATLVSVFKWAI